MYVRASRSLHSDHETMYVCTMAPPFGCKFGGMYEYVDYISLSKEIGGFAFRVIERDYVGNLVLTIFDSVSNFLVVHMKMSDFVESSLNNERFDSIFLNSPGITIAILEPNGALRTFFWL